MAKGELTAAPNLSAREAQALTAWTDFPDRDDFGFLAFKAVGDLSGLDKRHVRRTVRALARKGCLEFSSGLWTEDGEPAGSGYALTPAGSAALAERNPGETP